jgi:hypothetical protein
VILSEERKNEGRGRHGVRSTQYIMTLKEVAEAGRIGVNAEIMYYGEWM